METLASHSMPTMVTVMPATASDLGPSRGSSRVAACAEAKIITVVGRNARPACNGPKPCSSCTNWLRKKNIARRAGVGSGTLYQRLRAYPAQARRASSVRVLRQALGFTVSVIVAATGDFALLEEMAASGDPDLVWVVRENLGKDRLRRWPARLDHVQALLDA